MLVRRGVVFLLLGCGAFVAIDCSCSDTGTSGTDNVLHDASADVEGDATEAAVAVVKDSGIDVFALVGDDDAAVATPASFGCPQEGCTPDAGEACTVLLGQCDCIIDGGGTCTGGPGISVAICPYQFRYCSGLSACVTKARYYAMCPY